MKRAIIDFNKRVKKIGAHHSLSYALRGGRKHIDRIHEAVGEDALYTRIRESTSGYGKSVDVPYIFRRFDADANDPASYYFPQTDTVMRDASTYAKHLIYTLGGPYERREPRIYCTVPTDVEKWADVCCNIIRHYNCGLWDGFEYGIEYFEIWNEPDNPIFWNGSEEQYFALYAAAARKIKAIDPSYKVGGASFSLADERGFAFAEHFLSFILKNDLPLDFFSYHACDLDPESIAYRMARVREMLTRYGKPLEVFQTGWACVDEHGDERTRFDHLRTARGAAYAAAVMSLAQASDNGAPFTAPASMTYDVRASSQYGSMIEWYGEWQKPIYSLIAYKTLYALGTEVLSEGYGLYTTAATDGDGKGAILVSNFDDRVERAELLVKGFGSFRATYRVLDETRDLVLAKTEEYCGGEESAVLAAELRGYTTLLIELERI